MKETAIGGFFVLSENVGTKRSKMLFSSSKFRLVPYLQIEAEKIIIFYSAESAAPITVLNCAYSGIMKFTSNMEFRFPKISLL